MLTAARVGERIAPDNCHLASPYEVAVGVQCLSPVIARPGRERPRLAFDECLYRLYEPIV